MQEQITRKRAAKFVFKPKGREKSDLIANDYLDKMPRDENLRYELIGGEMFVSTAPRFIHRFLTTRIISEFSKYPEEKPLGYILATPGVIFSEFDGVIPDLIYVSHEKIAEILDEESGKFQGAPEIVIEILSPGRANERRDPEIKRELFEIYKVPEYWVVNPFEKVISVFNLKKGELKKTKIFKKNEYLTTGFLPGFILDAGKLFAD